MKKIGYVGLAALLVCGVSLAGQLSTTWTLRNVVDPPDLRDGLNADAQAADARLDALESSMSTGEVSVADLTITAGDISAITDAGTATNVLVSNATIDGEHIGADTIDDDALDFADITGADLTLTDCGAISGTTIGASAAITANSGIVIISGAYTGILDVVSTTLTFVVNGSVTNVLDADITN